MPWALPYEALCPAQDRLHLPQHLHSCKNRPCSQLPRLLPFLPPAHTAVCRPPTDPGTRRCWDWKSSPVQKCPFSLPYRSSQKGSHRQIPDDNRLHPYHVPLHRFPGNNTTYLLPDTNRYGYIRSRQIHTTDRQFPASSWLDKFRPHSDTTSFHRSAASFRKLLLL